VADRLLAARPVRLQRIADALRLPLDDTRRWLVTWIALHDIGKFSRTFQIKAPDCWPALLGSREPLPPPARHDELGRWMLAEAFNREGVPYRTAEAALDRLAPGWRPSDRLKIIDAVAGHHGRPPNRDAAFGDASVGGPAFEAAAEFIATVVDLLDPPRVEQPSERTMAELSWQLASLTIVADWIGSNETWFCYERPERDLASYWRDIALPRASKALTHAGLAPLGIAAEIGLAALAPEIASKGKPTDLQLWAETVALPNGPVLAILEDVTGSGKTEAALVLAHRLMVEGRAGGLYVALPTTATANAMFERLRQSYLRLFGAGTPSLALAHSARWLYRDQGFTEVAVAGGSCGIGDKAGTAGAQCAAWIADDRRKTFLAHVGVGTIDQSLFAVLPVKHQALRLWGLPERVLVIDEVHAYDAYMLRELEALVEFQVALGGCVILLSATLPMRMKRRLAGAFARALGGKDAAPAAEAYPLATLLARDTVSEAPCRVRRDLERKIGIRRLSDAAAAVEVIAKLAQAGAAVAWVRNTVDDAIEAAGQLRDAGLDPLLFHARFAMGERIGWGGKPGHEGEVLRLFGKTSSATERRGRVLVATQVIEQSLDVDFDLVISDLAPIDLLIQRAGRLWRHTWRKRPIDGPLLLIVSPDPREAINKDWYRKAFPRAAYVYENHALLCVTARELLAMDSISVPEDVRGLIEAVYSDPLAAPAGLEHSAQKALGSDNAKRSVAAANVLTFLDGYVRTAGLWESEAVTPTRIGDRRRRLRLARVINGRITPWCDEPDQRRAWALSELAVHANRVVRRATLPSPVEAQACTIEAAWSEYDGDVVLVVLQPVEDYFIGRAFYDKNKSVELVYGVDGLAFSYALAQPG
jgi:CRISPR-associated endonuclease/helicase Cas3